MSQTLREIARLAVAVFAAAEGQHLSFDLAKIRSELLESIETVAVTRHPLGFFHYELTPLLGLDARVRLHVWTEATLQHQDDLGVHHAHTWALSSCVLVGALTDSSYEAVPTPQGEFVASEIDYAADVVRPTDSRYDLQLTQRRSVSTGAVYVLPAGVPHSTEVLSFPTATLLVARETGRTTTPVYSRTPLREDRPAGRDQVNSREAAAAIQVALRIE